MKEYKKLLKNLGIFAIANLGSKLISILLVPYYTYVLSTQEYGTIDMYITSISLILPIITLSIFDATLRFTIKSNFSKKAIFTSSVFVVMLGNIAFLILYPIISKLYVFKEYIIVFYLILMLQSMNSLLAQFARGIGKVKDFALSGVISTIFTIVLNIIFLSKFRWGISGYFASIIISCIVCNLYLIFKTKIWKYINKKEVDFQLVKEMLQYSVPLIPNSLMWWIMNASDRYAINIFLGISANGIYAIANKVPTILNMLYSIFSQAWQLSAIEEADNKNKSQFYTNVFNIFSLVMLIGTSCILVIIRPIIETFLADAYRDSWKYVPFLLLSVVFTSFSAFLGTNYIAMKETKGVFKTSLVGAIVNIILNILLIPYLGLNGASIATMISFFTVWIIRIYDTKKFVNIKLDLKNLMYTFIVIFIQIAVLYSKIQSYLIIEVLLLLLLLLINMNVLKNIINSIFYDKKIVKMIS